MFNIRWGFGSRCCMVLKTLLVDIADELEKNVRNRAGTEGLKQQEIILP